MSENNDVLTKIISSALAIPGAKVNRIDFIKKNFSNHCSDDQIDNAINSTTKVANIDKSILDKIAKSCINHHTALVTGASTLAGIPGGLLMLGTVPADLVQYYYHVIIIAQKLAYIYGYPDLNGDADDELITFIILFLGVMFGAEAANKLISEISKRLAEQVTKRLPKMALSKVAVYQISKQIGKWVGIKVTKDNFSKAAGKAIPLLGGLISGGLTYFTFKPMSNKLKKQLSINY